MTDLFLLSRVTPISPQPPARPRIACRRAALVLAATGLAGCGTSALVLHNLPAPHWLVPVVVIALVTVLGIIVLTWCTRAIVRRLRSDIDRLERLADSDPLTEIANRRAFARELSREFQRARRYGHPLSVVLLDVDNFKAINDTYGHAAGDAALRMLASVLTGSVRSSDLAARIGGDEFALLLVQTDAEMAGRVVDRIRGILARWPFALSRNPPLSASIRASAGVGSLSPTTPDEATLLQAADAALYAAKGEQGDAANAPATP